MITFLSSDNKPMCFPWLINWNAPEGLIKHILPICRCLRQNTTVVFRPDQPVPVVFGGPELIYLPKEKTCQ